MPPDWIEVTVRYIRAPDVPGGPTTVQVGPCERGDLPLLPIVIGSTDAALLDEEPRRRASAMLLLRRISTALGAELVAAYLIADRSGAVRGAIELGTAAGCLEIEVEAGQALIAAAGLNLPLLADRKHFDPTAGQRPAAARTPAPYLLPCRQNAER